MTQTAATRHAMDELKTAWHAVLGDQITTLGGVFKHSDRRLRLAVDRLADCAGGQLSMSSFSAYVRYQVTKDANNPEIEYTILKLGGGLYTCKHGASGAGEHSTFDDDTVVQWTTPNGIKNSVSIPSHESWLSGEIDILLDNPKLVIKRSDGEHRIVTIKTPSGVVYTLDVGHSHRIEVGGCPIVLRSPGRLVDNASSRGEPQTPGFLFDTPLAHHTLSSVPMSILDDV